MLVLTHRVPSIPAALLSQAGYTAAPPRLLWIAFMRATRRGAVRPLERLERVLRRAGGRQLLNLAVVPDREGAVGTAAKFPSVLSRTLGPSRATWELVASPK